jgi:hypothetical protein
MALFGILALDLATKTGWALERDGQPPLMDYEDFSQSPGAHPGDVFVDFRQWFIPFCQKHKPARIIYEAPWLDSGKSAAATMEFLIQITGIVVADAAAFKLPISKASTNSVRSFFVGNQHAKKPVVMAECVRRGWKPPNFDASDAAALLAYGVHLYAPDRYHVLDPRIRRPT